MQGHLGPVDNGLVQSVPGFLQGEVVATQKILLMNRSKQQIKIPIGTKVGVAIPIDHPMALAMMCVLSQPNNTYCFLVIKF